MINKIIAFTLVSMLSTGNMYPRTMVVTEVNTVANTVELTDFTGHTWEMVGTEDWMTGDICACIMHTNGTEGIEDDIIVSARYNGFMTATVDRIENDYAVIEVGSQMVDVPVEDFNNPITEGTKLPISTATGSFEWLDGNDWYQFKSYDDTVWWALTTEDMGFVPEANKTYTLLYYDNGTTDCTECSECECEVYDDIFLTIK